MHSCVHECASLTLTHSLIHGHVQFKRSTVMSMLGYGKVT